MNTTSFLSPELQQELLGFAQRLVQIRSYSGAEEAAIRFVEQKMKALGYDEVSIDSMGNVLGRIGQGSRSILFDAHVDTVAVNDAGAWDFPPFGGQIVNGRLCGRGSVDMKSAVAASVYAGAVAKRLGYAKDRTIYVSCTVFEEDCDGENLKHLFRDFNLRPDYVVICEPSSNKITLGHKGKAQLAITTHGISAHGAAPDKGLNAVYEMADIIQRVEQLNARLAKQKEPRGTLVLSRINSTSASLNAVPTACEIYLDRRMTPGETEETVRAEMAELIAGKKADWEVGVIKRRCWTGKEITYRPMHAAWQIETDHELTQACISAYRQYFGEEPRAFDFWDFSTNAVTPVSLGIPTIGFGPGDYRLAHMQNESCPVQEIIDACGFYVRLMEKI